ALITGGRCTWQRPYIVDHEPAKLSDVPALLRAAMALAARNELAGVLTYDEAIVEVVAEIAAHLELPYSTEQAVAACRDKLASRRVFEACGVPSARYRSASTEGEAAAAAAGLGYPVVLKPRSLASSIGVVKVTGVPELPAAYARAATARIDDFAVRPSILVEEYLDGPEISMDAVITDDAVHFPVTARKRLGFPPYFEETGHVVSDVDPLPELPAAQDAARRAIAALGLRWTIAHVELRLTGTGPRIVEVNPRLGGDLIPLLGLLATGVDLPRAAASLALGAIPDLGKQHSRAAGIRFFYPSEEMVFGALDRHLPGTAPPWLYRLTTLTRPGTPVAPANGQGQSWPRLGFAIVTGADARECEDRLDEIEAAVRAVPVRP
ncbi:MAG: ATP-grasp domain-containing protein, partial [Micromonosporaceae bacterium]|nr:ATP-grasp domain-containing protein [Micromonosporaceae bacterium]